jgi:hypothetical protein
MTCFFCDGPAHPATGCQYTERALACWACTVRFWKWFREHQHKWPAFYAAAGRP